jgi:hypothetical protein
MAISPVETLLVPRDGCSFGSRPPRAPSAAGEASLKGHPNAGSSPVPRHLGGAAHCDDPPCLTPVGIDRR